MVHKCIWLYAYTLLITFITSIIVVSVSCPFAGPNTGEVVCSMLALILLSHASALILSFFFSKFTVKLVLCVCVLATFPAIIFTGYSVKSAIYHHAYAVYDTFRSDLITPIPASVKNIAYVPLEEAVNPDIIFRFDISSNDLQNIIATKNFAKVSPDELICPNDLFANPSYLHMSNDYVLYQAVEPTGPAPVVTLKVNEDHTHVIFRRTRLPIGAKNSSSDKITGCSSSVSLGSATK